MDRYQPTHPYRVMGVIQCQIDGQWHEQVINEPIRAISGDEAARAIIRRFEGLYHAAPARWHSTPEVVREREKGANL